jgi:hypothetical protein
LEDMQDLTALKVTMIGTGDGTTSPEHGTVATTPGRAPNLVVIVVRPVVAVLVRFAHAYVAGLVALLAAIPATQGTGVAVPFTDFLDLLAKSSTLALAGPCLEALRDVVTLFSRLKDKYPLMSGNV